MRCQEGGEEDDPPLVPRLGTRTGSTLLFSTTTRFCDMKQKRNYSFLTSRSIAKISYTIRSSGVLLSRFLNDIHSRGQILYSDKENVDIFILKICNIKYTDAQLHTHKGTILVRIAEEMDLMRQVLSLP